MKVKNLIICLFCLVWWSTLVSFNPEGNTALAMSVDDLDFSRRTDWTKAGYPGNIPNIRANIINVRDIGARGDGSSDDYGAIQSAIDSAPDPAVIFFPAGTYRFSSREQCPRHHHLGSFYSRSNIAGIILSYLKTRVFWRRELAANGGR